MTNPSLLDPYAVTALFIAEEQVADPEGMVASLIEDIGRRCDDAGASLIGHIKCHARAEEARFHCNLTSLRLGARCGEPGGKRADTLRPLARGGSLHLDLAVLVYGLPRSTLESLVSEALAASGRADGSGPFSGQWELQPPGRSGSPEPDPGFRRRQ